MHFIFRCPNRITIANGNVGRIGILGDPKTYAFSILK